jgi:hypothetical protein
MPNDLFIFKFKIMFALCCRLIKPIEVELFKMRSWTWLLPPPKPLILGMFSTLGLPYNSLFLFGHMVVKFGLFFHSTKKLYIYIFTAYLDLFIGDTYGS